MRSDGNTSTFQTVICLPVNTLRSFPITADRETGDVTKRISVGVKIKATH